MRAIQPVRTELRRMRLEARLTMGDVARALNLPVAEVSGVETGRLPSFTAYQCDLLAKLYGVPVDVVTQASK